jgi:hypothetical protein
MRKKRIPQDRTEERDEKKNISIASSSSSVSTRLDTTRLMLFVTINKVQEKKSLLRNTLCFPPSARLLARPPSLRAFQDSLTIPSCDGHKKCMSTSWCDGIYEF